MVAVSGVWRSSQGIVGRNSQTRRLCLKKQVLDLRAEGYSEELLDTVQPKITVQDCKKEIYLFDLLNKDVIDNCIKMHCNTVCYSTTHLHDERTISPVYVDECGWVMSTVYFSSNHSGCVTSEYFSKTTAAVSHLSLLQENHSGCVTSESTSGKPQRLCHI
ncbi:UNVERIFIED_CONTAM: hypothetical protein FKN15_040789 [Acipenser sinensis]